MHFHNLSLFLKYFWWLFFLQYSEQLSEANIDDEVVWPDENQTDNQFDEQTITSNGSFQLKVN